jgi:MFS superfamily sulfate permease-like transporter
MALANGAFSWHRVCISNPGKTLEFNVTLLSYIVTFITGVAVGFVFSVVILFRKRLDGTTEQMDRSREVT